MMPRGQRITPAEKVMKYAVRVSSGCLEWTGHLDINGYGQMNVHGRSPQKAHRMNWEIVNGAVPEGLCVLHKCDNPRCLEITHLFLGTNKDNSQDMVCKGRSPRGMRQGHSKLTDADVIAIRTLALSRAEIARRYSVTPAQIGRIRSGTNWKHLL